ncbi:DUF4178 domain-containing protein [Jannaschia sp. M317]|uniref:DUF4178 domain-containing protein n=1 Tax=Jannaschia sp. M317 TaxID=2867011 RepID=UPI0021A5B768|nr:DUF4178 domain-containing protein [Jannaschia sp. M317]UWQ17278.1 DUF4178 domain-containing protein [Jannaschia sp. M317]
MTGAVSAINCTNCGAGLEVLGGGRVTTQVCGYCGARLDANDAYRVLSVHAGMVRPETPFALGMTGEVDGVPFTIIGILELLERWEGEEWRWIDHMLYSPTHGYAWLTLEDGHTLLTRKVRDVPGGVFLTATAVERADARPTVGWRGSTYTYYATSNWQVDFVEGEFTWRAARGQRGTTVSLMPKGVASDMLGYSDNGTEREIEVTRYFPEAAQAFGVDGTVKQGVHPLQPYKAADGKGFYVTWFGALTAASVALALAVLATNGEQRPLFNGAPTDLPEVFAFDVASTARPVRVQMQQLLHQAWAEYDITLTDPRGTLLAETGRGISYYYGGSGDDAWSEGSRYSDLTFQPTTPGPYRLELSLAEAGAGGGGADIRVTVQEGRGSPFWAWIATGLFGLAFLWTLSSGWRHRAARWKDSDWSEEDD